MKVMSATINGAVDMIRYTLILRKVKKFGLHANVTMDTIGAGQKKMSSFLLLRNNMDVFDIQIVSSLLVTVIQKFWS